MRISDWSSDVCSSDLAARVLVGLCGMRPELRIEIGIGEQQIADMVAIARVTDQAIELTALEDDAVIALVLFVGEAAARILGHGHVDARLDRRVDVAPGAVELGSQERREGLRGRGRGSGEHPSELQALLRI